MTAPGRMAKRYPPLANCTSTTTAIAGAVAAVSTAHLDWNQGRTQMRGAPAGCAVLIRPSDLTDPSN